MSAHEGVEAEAYVANHLEKVRVDSERWVVEYRCPEYGKRWLSDQPWSEMHGGGPIRLRTFERVCRDLKNALNSVNALVGSGADDHVRALFDLLGDCDEV